MLLQEEGGGHFRGTGTFRTFASMDQMGRDVGRIMAWGTVLLIVLGVVLGIVMGKSCC